MSAKVKLTVMEGNHAIKELVYNYRTMGIVGRAGNCYLQLPNDDEHRVVSRHHCLLDIDPPDIRVQDLGSRNGTYVNGRRIGRRPVSQMADDVDIEEGPSYLVTEGDEIQVGHTILRVGVESSPDDAKGAGTAVPAAGPGRIPCPRRTRP
jgi:pSer/pThr/pTyr-binding forkhead associated (FHA) protein